MATSFSLVEGWLWPHLLCEVGRSVDHSRCYQDKSWPPRPSQPRTNGVVSQNEKYIVLIHPMSFDHASSLLIHLTSSTPSNQPLNLQLFSFRSKLGNKSPQTTLAFDQWLDVWTIFCTIRFANLLALYSHCLTGQGSDFSRCFT